MKASCDIVNTTRERACSGHKEQRLHMRLRQSLEEEDAGQVEQSQKLTKIPEKPLAESLTFNNNTRTFSNSGV